MVVVIGITVAGCDDTCRRRSLPVPVNTTRIPLSWVRNARNVPVMNIGLESSDLRRRRQFEAGGDSRSLSFTSG